MIKVMVNKTFVIELNSEQGNMLIELLDMVAFNPDSPLKRGVLRDFADELLNYMREGE